MKWVLDLASGVTACSSSDVNHPRAAALHLLEEIPAAHGAHEEDDFQRPDVGAGGDHVHGDGDARIVAVAERGKQVLRLDAGVDPCHFLVSLPSSAFFLSTTRAVPVR